MSRLPLVDARTMEKLLLRLGFIAVRQRGSHVFYRHPDGRTTTVPYHQAETWRARSSEKSYERLS